MTTQKIATTAAALVMVAASVAAGLTVWLLVTAPATVAIAVSDHNSAPIVQAALRAVHDVLAGIIRYL